MGQSGFRLRPLPQVAANIRHSWKASPNFTSKKRWERKK